MVGFCAALMWFLVVARWFFPMSLSIFSNAREVTGEFMWREIILMLLGLLTMWMDKTQYPFLLGLLFLVRRSACTYHAPATTSPFVVVVGPLSPVCSMACTHPGFILNGLYSCDETWLQASVNFFLSLHPFKFFQQMEGKIIRERWIFLFINRSSGLTASLSNHYHKC